MAGIQSISLFSGAGGLDIASEFANVPVIYSVDVDTDCVNTLHANNHSNRIVEQADLFTLTSESILESIGGVDMDNTVVIGGAPCQPFSKAGYWVGNDVRRGINDPRAKLVNEFIRVVSDLKPVGFVFENVESLLHPTNRVIVDQFLDIIDSLGYSYKLIRGNALDYGVSQKRKRLFIIGTKGTFRDSEPERTHCLSEDADKMGLEPYVPVGRVIEKFNTDDYFEREEVMIGGTYYSDLCEVPPGMNYKALTEWYGHPDPKFVADKRFWSFLLKLSPDLPSWTITAQPGPWVGPFHWDNRRLRAPEIAAIQSFPDDYVFTGNRRSIQKQIGNAVPPLMGASMIRFLRDSL